MLQNRINELNSAILDIEKETIYVTGFTREEMLQRYLKSGNECFSSKGLYDYCELDFHDIKNDALIIVRKDGKVVGKYQYRSILKDVVKYKENKDGIGKTVSLTFTIRKSVYSDHYHFLTENNSLLFNNKNELDEYLLDKFNIERSY